MNNENICPACSAEMEQDSFWMCQKHGVKGVNHNPPGRATRPGPITGGVSREEKKMTTKRTHSSQVEVKVVTATLPTGETQVFVLHPSGKVWLSGSTRSYDLSLYNVSRAKMLAAGATIAESIGYEGKYTYNDDAYAHLGVSDYAIKYNLQCIVPDQVSDDQTAYDGKTFPALLVPGRGKIRVRLNGDDYSLNESGQGDMIVRRV